MDWQIVLYIAAGIAAIAFLVLCIAIAVVLFSVKKNLDHVPNTLDGLEGQIQVIKLKQTNLLHKSNRLVENIQGKSKKLNELVDAVQGFGNSVTNLNDSVDRVQILLLTIFHKMRKKFLKLCNGQMLQWK